MPVNLCLPSDACLPTGQLVSASWCLPIDACSLMSAEVSVRRQCFIDTLLVVLRCKDSSRTKITLLFQILCAICHDAPCSRVLCALVLNTRDSFPIDLMVCSHQGPFPYRFDGVLDTRDPFPIDHKLTM